MVRVDVHVPAAKLDGWDHKILQHLSQDSRMSYKEVGRRVMIAPDTVRYRVRRMREQGVIERFIPDVAFRHFGVFKFSLFIEMEETSREQELLAFLKQQPQIISIIQYTDRFDLELVIVAADIIQYDRVVHNIMSNYGDVIDDVVHFQQIESFKSKSLPGAGGEKSNTPPAFSCDATDLDILSMLSTDARMPAHTMAESLGVSTDRVLYRIKRMRGTVISRFSMVVNFSALGYMWHTLLLNLTSLSSRKGRELQEYVQQMDGVVRCVRGVGQWDMILYIVSKSQAEYHACIKQLRTRFRGIIKDYDTLTAYKELKCEEFSMALYGQLRAGR